MAATEGRTLRSPLDFQQTAIAGLHNVQVHLGSAVFAVVQIQQGLAINQAHGYSRHLIDQGRLLQHSLVHQGSAGLVQGEPSPGDRGRPGAGVRLDHVAVDQQGALP